ncbi:MAG TPA: ATP-binding cassette domain-containing protein, partial [Glaciihabitans sp.]|nr:ATP-binding cassette domain-containing protein [Glaciihabitans sp.]
LIADEPTTALDSQVRDGVLELIAQQVENGMAVLVISHDLSVVASIAHRVAVMTAGSIVEEGPTESVLSSPRHPYTQRLLAATPSGKPRHTPLLRERATIWAPASATSNATWSSLANPEQRPAKPPTPLALEAINLSVSFGTPGGGSRPVLSNLSFALPAGTTLGLVGPSGSGKTTLARIALGLQRPDSGELRLLGQDWSGIPERERRSRRHWLGAIYQDPLASFDPRFTVGQLLTDAATDGIGTRSAWALPRVHQLLDSVGLSTETAQRRPQSLSGGQRQRVAIARALAANPRVLILDEPVSSLDVTIQAQILDLLDDLQREFNLSYLFISHDIDVIDHMSDDVLDLASN